jgi:hypothetical protein
MSKLAKKIGLKAGALLFFTLCFYQHANAQLFNNEEVDAVKKEWEVTLPAFPEDENLLAFYVSPIQTQKFAVDEKSLAADATEIRYTLVGISSSGVKNITYEGIQCNGGLFRRYAIGRHDGTWALSRHDDWKTVHFLDANRPQASLILNYFCQNKTIAGTPEAMLFRIRHKRSLQEGKYGKW